MLIPSQEGLTAKAEFFTMLADEARLGILYLLMEEDELKVKDITQRLGFPRLKLLGTWTG
jgi:DNA-binding transcriptional ArsR family regulator